MKTKQIICFLTALVVAPCVFAVDFEQEVEPILMANCVGCHAKNEPAAGLQLLSIDTILEGSSQRKVLTPGKPDESLLLHVITGEAEPKMPPKPLLPLEDEEVEVLRKWIASMEPSGKVVAEPEPKAKTDKQETKKPKPMPAPKVHAGVFGETIMPMIESNCLGCHGAEDPKAKLDLSSMASIAKGSKKGKVIVPGKPEESVFYQRVAQLDGAKPMPPKPMAPLSEGDIKTIHDWIAAMPAHERAVDVDGPVTHQTYQHDEIGAVAFHPTKPILAVGKLHRIDVYEFDKQNNHVALRFTLPGHSHLVRALRFSPDGSTLAAAGGKPAVEGELVLWDAETFEHKQTIAGHDDCIYDIEYSPDGQTIATCSYDRAIKLWDAKSGEETKTLLDHVDAVYAIAFSPDGARIASAAGDRTIKIWDAASGERIFTLSEPLDAQYSVAFHPDGSRLAAAGADKIIRVWQLREASGKLVESKFSHDGAVLDLLYSQSGETLFSTAEDKLVKAWSADDFQEQQVWGPQPDWVFSLASDSSASLLAMGCYDGTLRLYDIQSGDLLAWLDQAPKTIEPRKQTKTAQAPSKPNQQIDEGDKFRVRVVKGNGAYLSSLSSIDKRALARGKTHTIKLNGKNLADAQMFADHEGIRISVIDSEEKELPTFKRAEFTTAAEIVDTGLPYVLTLEMEINESVWEGVHHLWAQTPLATTNRVSFAVEASEPVNENQDDDSFDSAPWLKPPCIAAGAINEIGDVDVFRVNAKAGQQLVFDVMASAIGSGLTSLVEIIDEDGVVLAVSDLGRRDARMGRRFEHDGVYGVRIQDANLRKGGFYRLHVHERPLVESVFPLGGQKGAAVSFTVSGYNLGGDVFDVNLPATDDEMNGWKPFSFPAPKLAWSELPELIESGANDDYQDAIELNQPCIVNGRIHSPDDRQDQDWYRFEAKRGEKLAIAVEAQQLGSPLDSEIEIFDENGAPIEIASVRCVAETFLTLSDRDSRSQSMRLDSWTDLAINDYVMVGDEILKVVKLPDYPDEDVTFLSNSRFGWRYGLFGATPSHHAVYTPAYKVEIHPAGKTFAPNGMPVFRLHARNDDGGAPTYQKDSYFLFEPPAEGPYHVRITDAMQKSGPDFAYRLHVRPPQPDYKIFISSDRPNLHQDGRYPLNITADRIEGFDAPIEVYVNNLPDGFSATQGLILPGEESCSITIWPEDGAETTAWNDKIIVEAKAAHEGEVVKREARINQLSVVRPADVTIAHEQDVLRVRPGESVKCTVKIERRNGFEGRVPIDVRNLPFGVYVMDTGLNGILITENENERTYEIYVEPWVKPMERSFFSIASVETRSPIRHWNASNSSTLLIEAPSQASALNLN